MRLLFRGGRNRNSLTSLRHNTTTTTTIITTWRTRGVFDDAIVRVYSDSDAHALSPISGLCSNRAVCEPPRQIGARYDLILHHMQIQVVYDY